MSVLNLTGTNFDEEIGKTNFAVLDFWAPWCGPCKSFGPVFEAAAEKPEFSHITFAKINTQDEQELAGHFNIRSIPTLMIMRDQIIIFSQPGALPASQFEDLLTKASELDMDEVRRQVAEQQAQG